MLEVLFGTEQGQESLMSRRKRGGPYMESRFSRILWEILSRNARACSSSSKGGTAVSWVWDCTIFLKMVRSAFNCFLYFRQDLQISRWIPNAYRSALLSGVSCDLDINCADWSHVRVRMRSTFFTTSRSMVSFVELGEPVHFQTPAKLQPRPVETYPQISL